MTRAVHAPYYTVLIKAPTKQQGANNRREDMKEKQQEGGKRNGPGKILKIILIIIAAIIALNIGFFLYISSSEKNFKQMQNFVTSDSGAAASSEGGTEK